MLSHITVQGVGCGVPRKMSPQTTTKNKCLIIICQATKNKLLIIICQAKCPGSWSSRVC